MSNLKPVASWLSTAALLIALYLLVKGYDAGIEVAFSGAAVAGACLLSIALSLWNPPANPGK